MSYTESFESQKLKDYISNKKKYLSKLNGTPYQIVQKEILFLEKDILPVVLNGTNLLHYEFNKFAVLAFDAALRFKCNGALIYTPIHDNYEDSPTVGVVNLRATDFSGTSGAVDVCIDNMDLSGKTVKPVNLLLNPLV